MNRGFRVYGFSPYRMPGRERERRLMGFFGCSLFVLVFLGMEFTVGFRIEGFGFAVFSALFFVLRGSGSVDL